MTAPAPKEYRQVEAPYLYGFKRDFTFNRNLRLRLLYEMVAQAPAPKE